MLPTLQRSGRIMLEQDSRLDKEWRQDATEREQFWRELRISEIEQDDAQFNKELVHNVKRNAVDQLNMTYKDFTWKLDAELGKHSCLNVQVIL